MLKSYLSNFCLKTRALSSFRSLKALGSLLLLLFVGTEAQGILLVSNFSQPTKTDNNGNAEYHSYTESHLLVLGFWTPNTLLHTLTAIKVIIAADGKAPRTIELREANRNNPAITTFSLQGTYTGSGTNTYIPDKETVLKKDTLYLFALGHSKGGWGHVVQTSSNNEDATLQVDWRIADDLYSERLSKYTTPAVKMEVHGNYFAPASTLAAGGVLISNINESQTGSFSGGNQEFTTGPWSNGYKIRSIEVSKQNVGALTSQGLYQGNTKVADFNRVNAAQNSPTTAFTPTQSLTLAPNTTYSFRIGGFYKITSGSVDAYAGWSLGTHSRSHKMMIRIRADEAIAPAVIATPKTLVSNIKQSRNGLYKPNTTYSYAQAFRTGINPYGYALRGMEVLFGSATAPPRATIHENSPTGKKVATFEPPYGGSPLYGLPDYVVLKKTTTYYVVFSGGNAQLRATQSNHIDSDSLAAYKGWNIANALKWSQNGSAWQDLANGEAIRLRIAGEPLPSPPSQPTNVQRTAGNGRVTLTWEPPLVNNYAPLSNYRINYKKTKDPNYSDWKDYPATARSAVIASLTNGEQYDFQIRARSSEGQGPIFKTTATPNVVPPAPRSFKARGAPNNDAYLSWDAPTTGTVDYYQYLYYKSGENGTWTRVPGDASARSVTIGGLQNVAYTFGIRAVNSAGAGTFQSLSRTVGGTAINPPTNLRIKSASTTEATFTWDAPTGAAPTGYQYRYKKDTNNYPLAWTDIASGLEQTITGLTAASTYTFQVRATTSSKISASITLALAPLPPPQNFEVLTGPSKVYFSWDAPATGTVGSYEYFYESTWNPVPGGASARNLAVEISGFEQVLYLRAISNISVGLSVNSGEISVTPVASPTNFRVKSSTPTQATLVWDSAVDTSQIRYKTGTNDYPFAWTDITSGREQTITGLTPGTAHTFQLRSKVGTAVSAPLATTTTTLDAPPSAPQSFKAYRGDHTQAVLVWAAPSTGPTPTAYQYRYKKSSENYPNTWTLIPGGASIRAYTVNNLDGSTYNFQIRAISSSILGTVATATRPSFRNYNIRDIAAKPDNNQVTLTWNAPSSNEDATAYRCSYALIGGSFSPHQSVSISKHTLTIMGLVNGTTYLFRLYTNDLDSLSPLSNIYVIATPTLVIPSAPQNLTAQAGNTQATLAWTAPATGSAPTAYQYRYRTSGTAYTNNWQDIGGGASTKTYTVTGLTNNTAYDFQVRAKSDSALGTEATVSATPVPSAVSVTEGTTFATTVVAASETEGTTFTYSIFGGADRAKFSINSSSGALTFNTAPNFENPTDLASTSPLDSAKNNKYIVTVRATSGSGLSAITTDQTLTITVTDIDEAPEAPTAFTATTTTTTLTLSWDAPINAGPPITGYEYRHSGTDGDTWTPPVDIPIDALPFTFTKQRTSDYITIRATNDEGTSSWSTPPIVFTAFTPPQNLKATPANTQATLAWTAPTTGTPTGYQYRYRTGSPGTWIDWTDVTSGLSQTITSLTNNAAYTFEVRAKSASVTSNAATVNSTPNSLPTFTSLATASITEGTTAVATLTATDTDTDDNTFTYSIIGGADSAKFSLSAAALTFKTAPDFENPTDLASTNPSNSASNNEYIVTLSVTSGSGDREISTEQTLTITVTDIEAPEAPAVPTVTLLTSTTLTLNWTTPTNAGPPITDYDYRYSTDGNSWTTIDNTPINTTSTSITGLSASTSYQIAVRATSDEGDSDWSTSASFTTPATTPSAPRSFQALRSNRTQAVLVWAAPTTGVPTAYQYRYKKGSENYPEAWTPILGGASIRAYTVNNLDSSAHNFQIRAISSSILGVVATANCPRLSPIPPRDIAAKPDNNQVTLTWNPPARLGATARYRYSYAPIGGSFSTAEFIPGGLSARTHTVMGLVNGTTYLFRLGTDAEPNQIYIIATPTLITPSAPQNLKAQVGDTQATLTWTAPTTGTPTGYQYRHRTGSPGTWIDWTDVTSGLSQTITSLTNDAAYNFQVRTKSSSGPSTEATVSATPVASAATNIAPTFTSLATASVTEGTTAVITLIATDTDTDDTTFTYSIIGGADRAKFSLSGAALTFNTAPDFENPTDVISISPSNSAKNNKYIVIVRVTSGSNAREMTTDQILTITVADTDEAPEAPDAPTVTLLTSTTLTLNWTAPTNTGPPITDYDYRYSTDGNSWTTIDNTPINTTSTSITGLSASTSYQIAVRATSDEGDSDWSTSASFTTPATPPSAPRSFQALRSNRTQAVLVWAAPTTGVPTAYQYRYKKGSENYPEAWTPILGGASIRAYTVNNLDSSAHNFQIRAISSSLLGVVATATCPRLFDIHPRDIAAKPASNQVTLTWNPPASFGSATTRYVYHYAPIGGSSSILKSVPGGLSARTHTVTGLVNGTTYLFELRLNDEPDYVHIIATPTLTATPSAPQNLTATPASNQVTLAWTAPASGTPTGYQYRQKTSSDSYLDNWADTSGRTSTLNQTITSLTNNTTYNFQVRAKSDSGPSTEATVNSTPNSPPTFSSSATASVNEGTISVATLTATDTDTDDNTFTYSIIGGADSDQFSLSAAALSFKTAPDFENPTDTTANNEYIVTLRVTSGSGDREISTSQTLTITVADTDEAPEAPAVPTLDSRTPTTLTLNWTAPTNAGPPITDYDYRYRAGNAGAWNIIANDINDALTFTFTTLTASTSYQVGIRATNAEGTGSWSTSTSFTTLAAPPSAPQSLTAAPASTQVTLAWTAPASGTPTGYQYRYKSSGGYNSWTDTTSPKIIASLTNNTPYTFEVRAKSDSGPGAKATVSATPTAPNDPPTFSSLTTASVNEGTTAVTTLTATDPDSDDTTFTYSIFGGADSAKFSINSSSGALTFKTAPDFENPTDTTTNNEYIITLRVTSGSNAREMTTEQTLTVTVADTDEAPAAPDAPTFTSLTSATLTLNWTAPTNTGPPITDYDYRYSTDGNSWTTIANTPIDAISTPIVGLSASTLYYVAVRATNAEGTGSWSTSTTFTTPAASVSTVPSAPQSLMAQVGNQQITLAWEAPATGVTPTGYEYRYKSSGGYNSWTDTTSPKIIASLTNNTPYTFEVRAKSNSGSGAKATVSATPTAPNDPPTFSSLTTASVNEGTTAVTTLTATDPDSDDTTFTYSIFGGADSAKFSINSSSGALTFKTAPDFENPTDTTTNNEYIITLRVTSGSNAREMTTEQTLTVTVADTDEAPEAPAVPTLDSRTPTTLTLNWIAPTNAGPPITDYDYRYRAGNAGAWNIIANDINDALTFTFTTLTASTSYQVGIRATNAEGTGDWSTSTSFTTLADTPSAPQNLTAQAGNNQVTLAWTAPASGTPTGYEYRYKSSGAYGNWTTATSPKIIASLTNDTPHTFEVRAKSDSGPGETLTISATPLAPPSAPQNLTATPASNQVTLAWTAPASGTPTGYQYRQKTSSDSYLDNWADTSGRTSTLNQTITSLTNNTTYNFQVRAKSDSGPSTEATVNSTPNSPPTFSSSATASVNEGTISVATLTATDTDTDDNTFTYSIIGGADSDQFSLSAAALSFKTAPDFENPTDTTANNEYIITLRVTSGSGDREISTSQTLTVTVADTDEAPEAPAVPTLDSRTPTTLTLNWIAPTNAGPPITDYDYRYRAGNAGAWNIIANDINDALTFTFTTLTASTSYQVGIRATNAEGTGSWSTSTSFTTLADTPSAPQNLTAQAGNNQVTLAWTAPASGTPTGYEYRYKSSGAYGNWTTATSPKIIASLTNDTPHTFEVRAKSDSGPGETLTISATPLAPPSAPQNLTATPASNQVTLAWTAPASGTPTGYQYRQKTSSDSYLDNWADTSGRTSTLNQTITSLTNNTTYNFQVRAKSDSGPSTEATVNSTPNSPPTFSSSATASVNEGTISVATLTATDTDTDDNTFTYSIIGGADSDQFSLSAAALSFKTAPDFENPTDTTANNEYIITLRVTSGSGDREISTSQTLTVTVADTDEAPEAPAAPTLASRTSTTLTLNWTAPTNAGPPITDYDYRYRAGNAGAWNIIANDINDALTFTFTTLTASTSYQVGIRATNAEGTGSWSTSTSFTTLADTPSAPRDLAAVPNNNQITLYWTAPASGTPTGYEYRYRASGGTYPTNWIDISSAQYFSATSRFAYTITTGLTPLTTYNFQVRAKSNSGLGTEAIVNGIPDIVDITSPATFSINEGTTFVGNVVATRPSQITDVVNSPLLYSIVGGPDRSKFSINRLSGALTFKTPPDFEIPKDAAENNVYIVDVRSLIYLPHPNRYPMLTNQILTITVTDIGAPEAPAVPTLDSRTPTTLTLNWIAPTNAGPPITDYDYRYRAGNAGAWNIIANDINDALTFTFTTLTASTSYQVGIRATNAEGTGDWSTSTAFTTLAAPPSAPQSLTAQAGNNQVTLAWTAPASGTPTGYEYRYKSSGAYGNWTTATSPKIIASLTNDTAYTFEVRAKSDSGPGTEATVSATPLAPPSAPQSLMAQVGNTQITLAWTAPATGATPTGYQYRHKSSGGYNSWTDTTSLSQIIASLTNDTAYTFGVRAKSNSGPGTEATVSATPIASAAANAAPTFTSLATASVNEGTTAVTTLIATDTDVADNTFTYSIIAGADSAKFSINSSSGALTFKTAPDFETPTDATNNTPPNSANNNEYIVIVRVTSGSNARAMTTEQTLTVTVADTDEAPAAPDAPTFTSLTSATLTLNWTAPTNTGPPITDYDYRYSTDGNSWTTIANTPIDAISTPIVGLSASTLYYVAVRATNAEGTGSWSTSTTFTTPAASVSTVPSAPQSLMAQVGNQQITLAWEAPATGVTPTGYEYRYKSSGAYGNWTTATSPKIIASLTNNTPYTFEVRAKSNSGSGAKATVSATPTAPNDPPTFSSLTTASVNEGTTAVTTLTATDPDSDDTTFTYSIFGGADSAKFSINSSSGALTFKTAPDFENPTDTTTNNEYIITLRVTSGSNAREMTTEQTLTVTVADTDEAPEAPAAPTFTSLTSTTLTLNWIAPTNTGPPITDYDYRYSTDGNSWTTIANTPIDAISTPIVGLSASTLYYVAVRATNAEGTGSWSTSTTFTTPAASVSTVPSAPQSLMAQVGNQQITLAWTAPATGVTPTGYEYRYKSSGAYGNWTTATSPKIIASLTNNTPYTFEVRAKSNSGSGAKATVSATPTAPNDPPTFSSLTTASVNEGTTAVTTLTATDPDDTTFTYSIFGGADSAKFSINSSSGALTFKTAPDFETPTDTTTNNEYIITLRVTSGSNPREMTTEQTLTITVADTDEAPEAPAVPTLASRTPTTLTLNWTAPTNAGPPITDYDYRYRAGNAGAWNTIANDINDALTFTITTLTASTSYQVGIRATNDEGDSDWSTSTSFTTLAAPPSAPQSLTAAPASTQVTLAWTAPASGTPTGYEYRYKSSGDYNSWTDTTSPKIIASLTNNTPYTFEVRAKSNSGPGAKATVSATPTAPNDPPTFSSLTTASVNEGTTAVTTLTATDPDSDDTTFTYSIFGGADSAKFSINSSSGALTFKTAPDFENPTDTTTNNEYIITLRVTSGSNPREMTTEQTLTVTVADTDEAPEAPAVPTLDSRTPTTLTLNWIAPANTGPPITDYDYRYRAGNAGAWNTIANDINDALTFTITTLTASTSYQVGIRATNDEGDSDWSTSTSFTTLAAPPSAPQSLTAAPASTQVTLAWTAPASGTPTGYEYRYKSSGAYGNWTPATSPKIIASLINNTTYNFQVRAKSNSGPGTEATVSATPIASTAPNSPPTFTSLTTATVNEGTTAVTTLIATDPDDTTFTYSIVAGADSAQFSINSSSGALSFKTAPNFENPTDTTSNNEYIVTLSVTSGSNPREITTEQTLTITVTDTNEVPTFTSPNTFDIVENQNTITTLIATDPDGDDNTFTYSILGGADNAKFSLSGATLSFKTAPNFEATQSSANTNTYTLIVTATSGSGNRAITTEQTLTINVTDDTTSNDPIDQKAIGQPIITGSPQIGQRLTTSTTTIDDPIDGLTQPQYTYQWIRIEENGNEVVIQSANSYAYTPTQGDLGRTLKVRVEFIDDSGHSEILTSNATAAVTETTSTKELSAWLTRFGRATADQILNTVEERLRAYRSTGITLHFAGQHLPTHLTEDPQHPTENGVYSDSLLSWLTYGTKDQIQSQNMTEQELLMNSSFDLSAGNQENGFASLWGRMSQSTFQGYQNSLQLDGDITTGLLGADYTRGPWTAGLILSRSKGKGNYQGDTTGKAKASLNSLTPWAAYTGADQLSIWAATGYGKGDISLIPQEGSPQKTDIKLLLAALGTRGTLLDPSTGPRIELFSDARWVQTTSKSTTELKATQTHTARLRLGLEGSWYTTLSTGSVLIPRLTLGLRKDSGDAETGFGTDIGTHITLAMPQGLTLSLEARGLLSHQAKGFQDQGWSGTLQWDSKPDSEQGFTLSLSQSKGAASSGGTHALFAHETLEQLTLTNTDTKLIQANIAYGLPPFGNQLTARSELTLGLSDTTRQYSLAWHVSSSYLSAQSFDLSLQGTRHESIDGALAPRHSLGIQLGRQW